MNALPLPPTASRRTRLKQATALAGLTAFGALPTAAAAGAIHAACEDYRAAGLDLADADAGRYVQAPLLAQFLAFFKP